MTKLEKELKELDNKQIVKRFESLTIILTNEVNSRRGQTKRTTHEYECAKKELYSRLGIDYKLYSEVD